MMEFSLTKKALRNAFRCAYITYIPSCIVPSDFQAFFDTPPSSISRCSPAKKTTQPVVRPFFWGGFFFWNAPAVLRFSFSVACPSTNPMKCVGNLRIPRRSGLWSEAERYSPLLNRQIFLHWFYPNVFGGKHEKHRFQTTYKDHLLPTPGWRKPLEKRNKLFSAGFESWKKNKQRNDASIKLLPIYTFDHFEQKYADFWTKRSNKNKHLLWRFRGESLEWWLNPGMIYGRFDKYLENIGKYHLFRQLWLVLGVKLMEINSNLFSRYSHFHRYSCFWFILFLRMLRRLTHKS